MKEEANPLLCFTSSVGAGCGERACKGWHSSSLLFLQLLYGFGFGRCCHRDVIGLRCGKKYFSILQTDRQKKRTGFKRRTAILLTSTEPILHLYEPNKSTHLVSAFTSIDKFAESESENNRFFWFINDLVWHGLIQSWIAFSLVEFTWIRTETASLGPESDRRERTGVPLKRTERCMCERNLNDWKRAGTCMTTEPRMTWSIVP